MSPARCPLCESLDVEPYSGIEEASDRCEDVKATHRCRNERCRKAFRYTPPARELASQHAAGSATP